MEDLRTKLARTSWDTNVPRPRPSRLPAFRRWLLFFEAPSTPSCRGISRTTHRLIFYLVKTLSDGHTQVLGDWVYGLRSRKPRSEADGLALPGCRRECSGLVSDHLVPQCARLGAVLHHAPRPPGGMSVVSFVVVIVPPTRPVARPSGQMVPNQVRVPEIIGEVSLETSPLCLTSNLGLLPLRRGGTSQATEPDIFSPLFHEKR